VRPGILRAIVLQFSLLAATLLAAEAVLRLADLRYLRAYPAGAQRVYNYDAELGWFPVPNSEVTFTGLRTVTVRHNSLGLRDIEHDTAPRPTIAFVGDSFVWGYDAEQEERFTEVLRAKFPEHRIVNAGVTAYGTDQEYLLLRRLWDRINPSVLVLIVCTDNDRKDNQTNIRYDGIYKPYFLLSASGGEFRGIPVPRSRRLYFADNLLARDSLVIRAALSGYLLLRHPPVTVPDPTERLIAMMKEFVESRGAKFLVGLQYHDASLEDALRSSNIPYTSFDGAEHESGDGEHWTPRGHQFVAERLMTLLSENGVEARSSRPHE
jgi:hypothetical protein